MWKVVVIVMKVYVYSIFLPIIIAGARMSSIEKSSRKFKGQVVGYTNQNMNSSEKLQEKIAEILCREENNVNYKRLSCYYKFGDNKYLRLVPVKVEQLHFDPEVLMFHDVISDKEASTLRRLAKPKLHLGAVTTGHANSIQYRVSWVAWLQERSSEITSRITRRTSYITDMSVKNSEDLQVARFGVGGFQKLHYDTMFDKKINILKGIRIATVLFYLSDVELGGATVFVNLGLTVFPKKNAAIFWRNVLPTGDHDDRSFHAACPVLRGHKWTATKWISTSWTGFGII